MICLDMSLKLLLYKLEIFSTLSVGFQDVYSRAASCYSWPFWPWWVSINLKRLYRFVLKQHCRQRRASRELYKHCTIKYITWVVKLLKSQRRLLHIFPVYVGHADALDVKFKCKHIHVKIPSWLQRCSAMSSKSDTVLLCKHRKYIKSPLFCRSQSPLLY